MAFAAPVMAALEVTGVLEDDVRRFAAQFQAHLLQVPGRGVDDQPANFRRAGEGNLVHALMRRERGAGGFAEPGDDVDHAFGQTGFEQQFAQAQRREGRLLGGLEDDAVSGGEGGAELPGGHQQREVPRDDLPHDPQRLPQGKGMKARAGRVGHTDRNGVALDLRGPAGHVMEQVGGQRHVGDARDGAGLAVVQRLQLGQFIRVFQDEVADAPDQPAPFAGRHAPPGAGFEGAPRGGDRPVDVLPLAVRHPRDDRSVRRVEDLEGLARRGGHPLAADQVVFGPGQPGCDLGVDCRFGTAGGRYGRCRRRRGRG